MVNFYIYMTYRLRKVREELQECFVYIRMYKSGSKTFVVFCANIALTLFRMGIFGAAHGWGDLKRPPSLKSVTHNLQ